jgi:surfactin synthase thioesterase subunit
MPLICLPYAGGGASAFRGWSAALPEGIDIWAVELPGRESRFVEALPTDLDELVFSLADVLGPHVDRPYAIFGHSLGALVGIELAWALRAAGCREPAAIMVSAHRAPHLASPIRPCTPSHPTALSRSSAASAARPGRCSTIRSSSR